MNSNITRIAIILTVSILCLLGIYCTGCAQERISSHPPYIPPSYLSCTEISPTDLINAYYNNHISYMQVEAWYNNQAYVFKQIIVTENMLKWRPTGYVWVENSIQCYPLNKNQLDPLKVGDVVDIVGISMGLHDQFRGLVFYGCVYFPSGIVQLPVEDNGVNVIIPYQ